jgi:hypothetical protein
LTSQQALCINLAIGGREISWVGVPHRHLFIPVDSMLSVRFAEHKRPLWVDNGRVKRHYVTHDQYSPPGL